MKRTKKMHDKDISEANESKPVLKKPTFSKPQLILFAAAFALIGGYTLFRTFAAESVIASLEAEQMVLPPKAQVITDSSASAGKAIKLTGSATATASVNLPANTTSLTLSAKAKPCRFSNIIVKLYIDDTLVMSRKVNSSNWTKFSTAKELPKGVHKLSIKGSGIYSYPNICNSELSLDVVNFTGNSAPPTPAPTISFSASPTSVTAGSASTLTWNSTNATSCSASGAWSGTKPTSGSASTGALNATAIYNLTCQGASGTVSASSTVSVSAAPAQPQPDSPSTEVKYPWPGWYTPIGSNESTDKDSAAIIANLAKQQFMVMFSSLRGTGYTVPVYKSTATTPRVTMTQMAEWVSGVEVANFPLDPSWKASAGSDGHLAVIDENNYEWNVWVLGWGGPNTCGTCSKRGLVGGTYGNGRDGQRYAHTPLTAGLILRSEMESGRIPHALAFASNNTSKGFVPPVLYGDKNATREPGKLPMGAKIQLDPSVDLSKVANPYDRIVLRALQEFGAILVDTGGFGIYAEDELTAGTYSPWPGESPRFLPSEFKTKLRVIAFPQ